MADRNETNSPESPRQPKRRWLRRVAVVAIVIVAVLLVAAVAVQIVLWTDIPRDIVARQLERQLGVRVEVAKVRTGWRGVTSLEDLRLTFPLTDEPFLVAPSLHVTHTGLLKILIGQPLKIDAATVDQPTLVLRQQADGWNLEQLRQRPPGSVDATPQEGPPSIEIPDLEISNATILIIDAQDRRTTLEQVEITGWHLPAFGYAYQAVIPQHVHLSGEVNLRSLAHTAHLRAQSLESLVRPLVPAWPQPMTIDAHWRGRVREAGLDGRVEIATLNVAGNQATGYMDLDAQNGMILLQPRGLNVVAGIAGIDMTLTGGRIEITGEAIDVTHLRVQSDQGIADISGQWLLADNRGELQAAWSDLTLPRGVVHSGKMTLDLRRRLDGQQALMITLQNQGRAAGASWDAKLNIEALGKTWEAMQWTLSADALDVGIGGRNLDLDGLRAIAHVTAERIVLEEMTLTGTGLLEGEGELRLDGDRQWWVYVHGRRLTVPDYPQIDAQVMVSAWGNQDSVRLEELYGRIGDLQFKADGHYSPTWETPVVLKVAAYHPTPQRLDTGDMPPLRGGLDAEAFVLGSLQPLSLTFQGEVRGRSLRFQQRDIGDVNVAVNGSVLPDLVQFKTTEGEILGGRWRFNGRYDQRRRRNVVALGIHIEDLPLAQVGEVVDAPGLSGTLGGTWVISLPQWPKNEVTVVGDFTATDLVYAPPLSREDPDVAAAEESPVAAKPVLQVQCATGKTVLSGRRLRFEEVVLTQEAGEIRGTASVGLDQPRRLDVDLLLRAWEVPIPDSPAALRLTGTADLLIDLEQRELAGPIDLSAQAILADTLAGQFSLSGRFNGRGVDLPDIHADLFGGRAWGRLTFDVDRPLRSTGTFQFNEIQSDQIVALWPALKGLEGTFGGLMHLRPAQPQTRPIAPLRFSGYISPDGPARYKQGEIGPAAFDIYLDTRMAAQDASETRSLFRIVLDHAQLHLFGGRIDLWGRYSQHRSGEISSQLTLDLKDVSLNQIMQTVKDDDQPVPGLINGQFTLVDNPLDRQRAFGRGSLQLRDSELGNIRAFKFLYDLMNLGTDTRRPTGEGSLSIRLEGQTLVLQEMIYFNRGTEIRATGEFHNIWDMDQAEVSATIVGIGRPFRDLELPFMADVDDIFAALQRNATTVRVSGTIREPEVRQATIDEIGQGLRSLFLGEAERP